MARKRAKADATEAPVTTVVVMCLYVAGRAPNSVKAIANLEAICRQHLKDGYKLEIVDVCEHPHRALNDGVLVTPSLTKVSPAPGLECYWQPQRHGQRVGGAWIARGRS